MSNFNKNPGKVIDRVSFSINGRKYKLDIADNSDIDYVTFIRKYEKEINDRMAIIRQEALENREKLDDFDVSIVLLLSEMERVYRTNLELEKILREKEYVVGKIKELQLEEFKEI